MGMFSELDMALDRRSAARCCIHVGLARGKSRRAVDSWQHVTTAIARLGAGHAQAACDRDSDCDGRRA